MKLGKLEKKDLRGIWKNEAVDFTNWLAQEENLTLLSEEIGLSIKPIRTEAGVGNFSVDILAEDEDTGEKVIIENQLEMTDHEHLGKTITYAAGYDAHFVIWVVKDIREEHKQAIDWLNERTDENVNFFLVKVELWSVSGSDPAPKFQIISKPNDWVKALRGATNKGELTETKLLQLEYWTKFKEFCMARGTILSLRKASPQHWFNISMGSSSCYISLSVNTKEEILACWVWIPDSKETFHKFHENRVNIEKELGLPLEWNELPEKKASWVKTSLPDSALDDPVEWAHHYFEWMLKTAEQFYAVFKKYL
ncbi:MAG TPA: DUF4268 domain-containing protein [Elusimicrobiota bacterium]|nr:DUF4268 domain-containing protein [Elusimicrobiota bacterium]